MQLAMSINNCICALMLFSSHNLVNTPLKIHFKRKLCNFYFYLLYLSSDLQNINRAYHHHLKINLK